MIVLIFGICLCVIGALAEIDGIRRLHKATETNYRAEATLNRASETFRRAEAAFQRASEKHQEAR